MRTWPENRLTIMKIKAFIVHLMFSITAALIVLAIVLMIWYPPPLAEATGVTSILIIILSVDAIIGPLLTFIVYKPKKPSLRFDLTIIAALQIIALGYGVWTVSIARPVWIVFAVDRFELVQAHTLASHDNDFSRTNKYSQPPWFGPKYVAVDIPENNAIREKLLMDALQNGFDVFQKPVFYSPLEDHQEALKSALRPLADLKPHNPIEDLERVKSQYPQTDCWVPLSANTLSMVILFKCNSPTLIGIVNLRPWPP